MKKDILKKQFKKIIITTLVAAQCLVTISYGALIDENSYQITVSNGVVHKRILQTYDNGVQSINLIIADLNNSAVDFELLYNDVSGFVNRETLSKLVAQKPNTVAAINGDFFSMSDPSSSMGVMVDGGKVLSSPYYDNGKLATFIVNKDQEMIIDYLRSGVVITNKSTGNNSTGYSINKHSSNYASPVIFTNEYRKMSIGQLSGTADIMTEIVISDDTVVEIRGAQPSVSIPRNGYVISASGAKGDALTTMFNVGDKVEIKAGFENIYPDIISAVGGGTIILKDGMLAPITHSISGKSQRSAVGITYDKKLIFVTVDGRQSPYIGMDEKDLADFLRTQNVKDAMMLDGGGSTELIVNGSIVNNLSTERKVLNGIAIANNNPRGSLSKLEAVLETDSIVQGDRVKLAVSGFDKDMNPVKLENITVSGSGVTAEYLNGYVTFKTGGTGSITVKSGSASTKIDVNVAKINTNDPKNLSTMTDYDIALIPDTNKDSASIMGQTVNGLLLDKINSKSKLAVNNFNKNQEFSDAVKVTKESIYKGAQYVEKDGIKYIGLDVSKGIGGVTNQWQMLKDELEGSNSNIIIMLNSKFDLNVSEKAIFRKLVQAASKTKNIYVVSKGDSYSSYAEGNVSYITTRDFTDSSNKTEEDYKFLAFKKSGNSLNYSFQNIF